MFRLSIPVIAILGCTSSLSAQEYTQTIKGRVLEKVSRQPLAGASIRIVGAGSSVATVCDSAGAFQLKMVPVGRRRIECSMLGYAAIITDNIDVNSAKEVELTIEMEEQFRSQEEVIIRSRLNPKIPVNRLSVVSTRSFSAEEMQRFAASANDPGRMAMGFPGVQPSKDTRSDIVIKGNSPAGMQWRLEGGYCACVELPGRLLNVRM
jgi:hypothetical protein